MGELEELCLTLTLDLVPFFNIFREDMEENINSLAKDLEQCCVGNPEVEVIHTGSGFEGLSLPHLDRLTAWNTDADHMIIRTDLKLLEGVKLQERTTQKSDEELQGFPGSEPGSAERAISSTNEEEAKNIVYIFNASHAGYAHLTKKQFSQPVDADLVPEHCLQNLKFIEDSKDLIPLNRGALMTAGEGSITGPSFSLPYTMGTFTVNRDFVYGLKCSFWPSQGEEWVHRKREHCWPSTAMVSTILAQGCHVVPVGSHNSVLRDFEWRFSFSVAELMLARSLSEKQKLAYSVLKALIKNEMKLRGLDVFSSYHLKTSLFWFLEEKGIEFWGKNSLAKNIFNLLGFLIAFYARDCLPNYFISKNNMIDHRSSKEILATCHALRDIRDNVIQYLCRYIETNQSLPVLFDTPLTVLAQRVTDNFGKIFQNCKYNFLVMALAHVLKKERRLHVSHNCLEANSLLNKAQVLHQASINKESRDKLHLTIAEASVIPQAEETPTPSLILSLLEEYLFADQLKVTESSAVALAVFNVFLTLHPNTTGDNVVQMNSLEHQDYLTNPCFKECLFWAGRLHETYGDAIYDFVLKKWKNGPQFYTDDDEARKFMKLLMIILGKPTKQAGAVTGSLVKRNIEGQRFLMIRVLADYLLHVHLECSYIAFQAAAYLMDRGVLSEIYNVIKWSACSQSKARAIELVLSKHELQAELSEEEFGKLVEMHLK